MDPFLSDTIPGVQDLLLQDVPTEAKASRDPQNRCFPKSDHFVPARTHTRDGGSNQTRVDTLGGEMGCALIAHSLCNLIGWI